MNNGTLKTKFFLLPAALIVFAGMLTYSFGTTPKEVLSLTRLELQGGPKGLALAVTADQGFPGNLEISSPENLSEINEISIRIPNSSSTIRIEQTLKDQLPDIVSQFDLVVNEDDNAVDVTLHLSRYIALNLKNRVRGNKLILLFSYAPFQKFSWVAQAETTALSNPDKTSIAEKSNDSALSLAQSEPSVIPLDSTESIQEEPSQVKNSAPETARTQLQAQTMTFPSVPVPVKKTAVLTNMNIMQSGFEVRLNFSFDMPVSPRTKKIGHQMLLLFPDAMSGLNDFIYTSPHPYFKHIEIKRRIYQNEQWLGVVFQLSDGALRQSLLMQQKDNTVSLLTKDLNSPRYLAWYAGDDKLISHTFVPTKKAPAPDIQETILETTELAQNQKKETEDILPDTHQYKKSIEAVVIGNLVNLRSAPTVENDQNVICKLKEGASLVALEERQDWVKVQGETKTGWVHRSLLDLYEIVEEPIDDLQYAQADSTQGVNPESSVTEETLSESSEEPESETDAQQSQSLVDAVSVDDEESVPDERDNQQEGITLITTGSNVNLRSSPDVVGVENVIGKLDKGEKMTLLEETPQWYRIRSANLTGWIFSSLVKPFHDSLPEDSVKPYVSSDDYQKHIHKKVSEVTAGISDDATQPQEAFAGGILSLTTPAATESMDAPEIDIPGEKTDATAGNTANEEPELAVPAQKKAKKVVYRKFGRDPFVPFQWEHDFGVPGLENLVLVGILHDENDKIALLENKSDPSKAYVMRERDPVKNGTIWRINPDNVMFLITEYGISRTYTLQLKQPDKEENTPLAEVEDPSITN